MKVVRKEEIETAELDANGSAVSVQVFSEEVGVNGALYSRGAGWRPVTWF